jgi:hypothetical protein
MGAITDLILINSLTTNFSPIAAIWDFPMKKARDSPHQSPSVGSLFFFFFFFRNRLFRGGKKFPQI